MFLYIHGFRTLKNSYTANLLQKYFQNNIISSDHPIEPKKAVEYMEETLKNHNIKGIIASSLGGFYATYLSEKYHLKTVLINPSVKPYETLKKHLGKNKKFNGEEFIWKEKYLKQLKNYKVTKPTVKNYMLLLQKGDEILNFEIAKNFYRGAKIIVEENGCHRFDGLEKYFDDINSFLFTP